MKTSELTGAALDWAVAKIEASSKKRKIQIIGSRVSGFKTLIMPASAYHNPKWANYSTDWEQGGPIIERERIATKCDGSGTLWVATQFWACVDTPEVAYGPTLLTLVEN